jgi:hypothetical protein
LAGWIAAGHPPSKFNKLLLLLLLLLLGVACVQASAVL